MVERLLGKFDPSLLIDFGAEREPRFHRAPRRGLELTGLAGFDQRGTNFNREFHNDLTEPKDDKDLAVHRQAFATKRLLPTDTGPPDEMVGETLLGAVGIVDYWSCSLTT